MTPRAWLAGAALAALAGLAAFAATRRAAAPRLLWWQGVAVRWAGDRGVALAPDGRLLSFEPGPRARETSLEAGSRPILEALTDRSGAVWLVDGAGTILRLRHDGALDSVGRTPFDIATLAAGPHGLWAARSPVQFTFRPESAGAPLAVRLDDRFEPSAGAGGVIVPDVPFLTQLANASRLLPLSDSGVVVAPFVRDEVIRYDQRGREVWRTTRGLTHATPNPRLIARSEPGERPRVIADYAPVNLGLAQGPDGTIYVLSTVAARTDSSRLDALDQRTGAVRRTWRFGTALPTLLLDRKGEVRLTDPTGLLPTGGAARRAPFPPFAVAGTGRDSVRLADFAGRVVLVNFWASWCAPCREELPSLDSLAGTLDRSRVVFVALSDDVSRGAATRFLDENRLCHMVVGFGYGDLKGRYHYVGLPHTALLDSEGRVIRRWIGYTGPRQIGQVAAQIESELAVMGAPGVPAHHH